MKTSLHILALLLGFTIALVVIAHMRLSAVIRTIHSLHADMHATVNSPKQGH